MRKVGGGGRVCQKVCIEARAEHDSRRRWGPESMEGGHALASRVATTASPGLDMSPQPVAHLALAIRQPVFESGDLWARIARLIVVLVVRIRLGRRLGLNLGSNRGHVT